MVKRVKEEVKDNVKRVKSCKKSKEVVKKDMKEVLLDSLTSRGKKEKLINSLKEGIGEIMGKEDMKKRGRKKKIVPGVEVKLKEVCSCGDSRVGLCEEGCCVDNKLVGVMGVKLDIPSSAVSGSDLEIRVGDNGEVSCKLVHYVMNVGVRWSEIGKKTYIVTGKQIGRAHV